MKLVRPDPGAVFHPEMSTLRAEPFPWHRVLLLWAILGLLWTVASRADTQPPSRYVYMQGDEYQLTRESDSFAVVEYLNSAANMTPGHDVVLYHDGLEVTITTEVNPIGARGAERITVRAPEGWVVDPPHLDVVDGSGGVVLLHRSEFLGM